MSLLNYRCIVLASGGRLLSECLSDGRCLDDHTSCKSGTCHCVEGYFIKRGQCGESPSMTAFNANISVDCFTRFLRYMCLIDLMVGIVIKDFAYRNTYVREM